MFEIIETYVMIGIEKGTEIETGKENGIETEIGNAIGNEKVAVDWMIDHYVRMNDLLDTMIGH